MANVTRGLRINSHFLEVLWTENEVFADNFWSILLLHYIFLNFSNFDAESS